MLNAWPKMSERNGSLPVKSCVEIVSEGRRKVAQCPATRKACRRYVVPTGRSVQGKQSVT